MLAEVDINPFRMNNPFINQHGIKVWIADQGNILMTVPENTDTKLMGNPFTNGDKVQIWIANEQLHRESAPAVLYPNGNEEWWEKGKRTR